MAAGFQSGAFQAGAFQLDDSLSAFQPCAFQYGAFQVDACPTPPTPSYGPGVPLRLNVPRNRPWMGARRWV